MRQTKQRYTELTSRERTAFLKQNRGFLTAVQQRLKASGTAKSKATVSRTWNGEYPNPEPAIVNAISREYARRIAA